MSRISVQINYRNSLGFIMTREFALKRNSNVLDSALELQQKGNSVGSIALYGKGQKPLMIWYNSDGNSYYGNN